jgi:hypothetical protein
VFHRRAGPAPLSPGLGVFAGPPSDALRKPPERARLVDKTWKAARRVLIDEFLEEITVLPDYLEVKVHGASPLHNRYQEVGMRESGF